MNLLQRLFRRRLAPGLLTLACAFPVSFSGQIQLDGLFEDWSGIPANWEAPAGTTGPYTGLALTQDAASLFLRLSLSAPVALDETILPNAHILLLDTDNNPATLGDCILYVAFDFLDCFHVDQRALLHAAIHAIADL